MGITGCGFKSYLDSAPHPRFLMLNEHHYCKLGFCFEEGVTSNEDCSIRFIF